MRGTKPTMRKTKNPVAKAPKAPSWLSKDGAAEWNRVLPILVERKILTDADMGSLENYCVATGRVREIERALQLNGIDPVFVRMQDKAIQTARQLADVLGLTPVSRSRPAVRETDDSEEEDNPLNA